MDTKEKWLRSELPGPGNAAKIPMAARGVGAAGARTRRAGGPAGWRGLALLCLTGLMDNAAAQVEYRCFLEPGATAKPADPASASFAYRGTGGFSKWRDGRVPVTVDHRGKPEGYPEADFEKLLLSVFGELEGLADLTFEYHPIPGDREMDDEALDEAFENFAGMTFDWDAAPDGNPDYAGVANALPVTYKLPPEEKQAVVDMMLAELGYLPIGYSYVTMGSSYFLENMERDPLKTRYLVMHRGAAWAGVRPQRQPAFHHARGAVPV